jgi:hypothetical protein
MELGTHLEKACGRKFNEISEKMVSNHAPK